jgi:serine protease DegQ
MTTFLTQLSESLSEIVSEASASIVRIDGARRSSTSGIAWAEDLVITAAHAIRAREGIRVSANDHAFDATVAGGDGGTDIALLRVEKAGLQPIRWSDREPRVGNIVVAAGRPGRSVRAAFGIVSAAAGEWRAFDGSRIDRYIDVDGSLPRGFSGGPLLSPDGALGMNTSRVAPGGTTIPRATLARVVDELLRFGTVKRPLIGIGVYPVDEGLLVMSVKDDSSAARAGILVGDIVRSIDGEEVRSPRELNRVVQRLEIGREVEIGITRGGERRTMRIAVGGA